MGELKLQIEHPQRALNPTNARADSASLHLIYDLPVPDTKVDLSAGLRYQATLYEPIAQTFLHEEIPLLDDAAMDKLIQSTLGQTTPLETNPTHIALVGALSMADVMKRAPHAEEGLFEKQGSFFITALTSALLRAKTPAEFTQFGKNMQRMAINIERLAQKVASTLPELRTKDITSQKIFDYLFRFFQGTLATAYTYIHLSSLLQTTPYQVLLTTPSLDIFYKADLLVADKKSGKTVGIVQVKSALDESTKNTTTTAARPEGRSRSDPDQTNVISTPATALGDARFFMLPVRIAGNTPLFPQPNLQQEYQALFQQATSSDIPEMINPPVIDRTQDNGSTPISSQKRLFANICELIQYCAGQKEQRQYLNVDPKNLHVLFTTVNMANLFAHAGAPKFQTFYQGRNIQGLIEQFGRWKIGWTQR